MHAAHPPCITPCHPRASCKPSPQPLPHRPEPTAKSLVRGHGAHLPPSSPHYTQRAHAPSAYTRPTSSSEGVWPAHPPLCPPSLYSSMRALHTHGPCCPTLHDPPVMYPQRMQGPLTPLLVSFRSVAPASSQITCLTLRGDRFEDGTANNANPD